MKYSVKYHQCLFILAIISTLFFALDTSSDARLYTTLGLTTSAFTYPLVTKKKS